MLSRLFKKIFEIEDEFELFNESVLNDVLELLLIASITEDRDMYQRIIKEIREAGENHIIRGNPVGHIVLALWYGFCGDYYKALICVCVAAENEIPIAVSIIQKLEKRAKESGQTSLLLSEIYFLSGRDDEGMKCLENSIALGLEAGERGLDIRKKDNVVKVNENTELPVILNRIDLPFFNNVIVDYTELGEDYHQKVVMFTKGIAFGRGIFYEADEENKRVCVTHGYKERVLKSIKEETDIKSVTIKCFDDANKVADMLLNGDIILLKLSECPHVDAKKAFDYLCGVCCALKGYATKVDEDVYLLYPKMMERIGC